MRDYSELDDAILRFLENRDKHPTNSGDLMVIARRLTMGEPWWRLIDRRMQALRKAGRIRFDRTATNRTHGWVVLPAQEAQP